MLQVRESHTAELCLLPFMTNHFVVSGLERYYIHFYFASLWIIKELSRDFIYQCLHLSHTLILCNGDVDVQIHYLSTAHLCLLLGRCSRNQWPMQPTMLGANNTLTKWLNQKQFFSLESTHFATSWRILVAHNDKSNQCPKAKVFNK